VSDCAVVRSAFSETPSLGQNAGVWGFGCDLV